MKLTVSEVAQATGIHPHTVRNLEARGLIRAERDCNGWRKYDKNVIAQIRRLYALTDEKNSSDAA